MFLDIVGGIAETSGTPFDLSMLVDVNMVIVQSLKTMLFDHLYPARQASTD